jgi:hypothetical protein
MWNKVNERFLQPKSWTKSCNDWHWTFFVSVEIYVQELTINKHKLLDWSKSWLSARGVIVFSVIYLSESRTEQIETVEHQSTFDTWFVILSKEHKLRAFENKLQIGTYWAEIMNWLWSGKPVTHSV